MPAFIREQSPFLVRLRDIADEGHTFALTLKDDWCKTALGTTPLNWVVEKLETSATLHKTERDVVVVGQLQGEARCDCSRCTGPAKVALSASFDLVFVPSGDPRLHSGTAKDDDDGESEVVVETGTECVAYHDEAIDLDQPLREQLLLALPYAPLCRYDCKGLCPSCGIDRNEGTCTCTNTQPTQADHRWDALKKLKL